MKYGIDISDAQHGIDIVELKRLNPDLGFVGVKSTGSGGRYVNPDCDRVMQQCFSIGLPCFNYDFVRDMAGPPPANPDEYADNCAANITGYRGKAGFAYDEESVVANDPLMADPAYAAEAIRRIAADGVASPGFYIDYRTLTNGANWGLVRDTGAWKWRASYVYGDQEFDGFGNPDWSLMYDTPAWPEPPAIWQYTSHGKLNGWPDWLDFNAFDGDDAGLLRLFGITTTTGDTSMDLTPQNLNDIADAVLRRVVDGSDGKQHELIDMVGSFSQVVDNAIAKIDAHVDSAVKGIALTPTDAQVQAVVDKLLAAVKAQWNK